MAERPRCWECGAPATKLCDFPVSGLGEGEEYRSCDRPMCEAHSRNHGWIRLQKAGPGGRGRRCETHTVDYCGEHHETVEAAQAGVEVREDDGEIEP
jgi:hypothetical protein